MGRRTIKLTDEKTRQSFYLLWSTVVDAPVSHGMSKEKYLKWYQDKFGSEGLAKLNIARVVYSGTDNPFDSLDDLISLNRAGENESHLSLQELIERYCNEN